MYSIRTTIEIEVKIYATNLSKNNVHERQCIVMKRELVNAF
jgi:hypothetical protein